MELNISQTSMYIKKVKETWNNMSALKKEKINNKRKQTCLIKYNVASVMQVDLFKNKMLETKRKNNSWSTSNLEIDIYNKLKQKIQNIEYQFKSDLYPFLCDFYLHDYNVYIEIQGTWTHGLHPFDPLNENDIKILNKWKEKSINSTYYKSAINIWTKWDVIKRAIAKMNKLNFLEFFSNNADDIVNEIFNYLKL